MRKFILAMALPLIKKLLKENEAKIIKAINDKIDVPKLTEEQEKELFTAIMDSIINILS